MKNFPSRASQTSRLLSAFLETSLGTKRLFGHTRSQDATMLQIQALGILFTQPGLSPTSLRHRLYLSSSAMTQLLQRLEDAEWVQRDASLVDRRAVSLHITTAGRTTLARYGEEQNKERILRVFNALSDQEKQELTLLLEKLNDSLRKEITNEKE